MRIIIENFERFLIKNFLYLTNNCTLCIFMIKLIQILLIALCNILTSDLICHLIISLKQKWKKMRYFEKNLYFLFYGPSVNIEICNNNFHLSIQKNVGNFFQKNSFVVLAVHFVKKMSFFSRVSSFVDFSNCSLYLDFVTV